MVLVAFWAASLIHATNGNVSDSMLDDDSEPRSVPAADAELDCGPLSDDVPDVSELALSEEEIELPLELEL